MNKLLVTFAIALSACTAATSGVIVLHSPAPNSIVTSPLTVKAEAPGNWFFEANIIVELIDQNGEQIAITGMMTAEDWMTTDMVGFEGIIEFETDAEEGFLVIHKDNASGLPEHDASEKFPIRFK